MITIRLLTEEDTQGMLDLHVRNRAFFKKFIPVRPEEYYTLEGQLTSLQNERSAREAEQRYSFGIFLQDSGELIGNVTLAEILRGALQSCFIGYYLDEQQNGKGYMSEAVRMATEFGFQELNLHRIEAGVMPHNIGSIRVLEKAGFVKEGIARQNVLINGKWEDHQVLAIINENYK
ncbi:ribosomal-protein-alanine N-acetyltransferase [Tumebacillus sp. BK434]|uniref:GNAT family N-acetyltransferase n=1 Tax=Tumebacillus sp. BK434 TaxID=2512169 RepID=UPI00104E0427|nr:GNAT family protein [Tumebacillus sp. BK434]TCP58290.1 ribosomal-protein-alanine N-acetyltransferase [Tumebacillus sp. BK434]